MIPPQSLTVCMVGTLPKPFGGLATHCYYDALNLSRLGILVHFVDTADGIDKRVPPGIHYHSRGRSIRNLVKASARNPLKMWSVADRMFRLTAGLKPYYRLQALGVAARLSCVLDEVGCDLVHAYYATERSLAAVLVAQAFGIPSVVTILSSEFTNPAVRSTRRGLTDFVVNHAHTLVSNSCYTRDVCEQNTGKVPVPVYPSVDTIRFRPFPARAGEDGFGFSDKTVVLYVGRLVEDKGIGTLLRALALLRDKHGHSGILCAIAGPDWDHKNTLLRQIAEDRLSEAVLFLDEVPEDELPALYSRADVLVLPTKVGVEGFGLVLVEAMACGTPVVGSRIGAIPEVVREGETGFLFEPGDCEDLAAKLDILLTDPELRKRMGERAETWVSERFSAETSASQLSAVYRACLDDFRARFNKGTRDVHEC